MRIAVVTPWYPEEGSGAGSFVRDHARTVTGDHEVAVLHLATSGRPALDVGSDGIPVVRLPPRLPRRSGLSVASDAQSVARGLRLLRGRGFRPDLLHAHVFGAGLAALPAARTLRIPLVLSEHYSGLARGDVPRRGRAVAAAAYRAANAVTAPSASLSTTIQGVAPGVRVRLVPNPVDTERFSPPPARPASPPHRLLAVASLVPVKGVAMLVDALGELGSARGDVRLTVIGEGPERADIERRVTAAGLEGLVTLAGRRTRAEVAEEMRRSHLLVAPSEWETFSVAVAEALCCGLPVLATRVGALPELVDAGSGRLVDPSPAALADGLRSMLTELERYEPAAIAAAARRRWGADQVGALWRALYAELAD